MSIKTKILRQLEQQPCTRAALKARLGNDKKVVKALAQLCEKNKVLCREGVYALCTERAQHAVPCTLVKLARGFGFARPASGGPDVFIPGRFLRGAMPGDEVLVSLFGHPQKEGSAEGEVLAVTKEQNRFAGTVERREGRLVFLPDVCPALCLVLKKGLDGGAREGEKVAVELLERGGTHEAHRAGVAMRFGSAQSARACAKAILYEADIETHFSTKAKDEAKALAAAGISEQELHGRLDLRGEAVFTIDSADTKDIDDAVSIARRPGGFSLGVHIADVSHYVKPGTALEEAAFSRGTSVYYADKVVPMLPRALSNGICSLNEGEDRLCFSCLMELSEAGEVQSFRFVKSVIRSRVKGVYGEINEVLAGEAAPGLVEKYAPVRGQLAALELLYRALAARRAARGALELDTPEAKLSVNTEGVCVGVARRSRGLAERIIEECMLCANMCARGGRALRVPCARGTQPPEGAGAVRDAGCAFGAAPFCPNGARGAGAGRPAGAHARHAACRVRAHERAAGHEQGRVFAAPTGPFCAVPCRLRALYLTHPPLPGHLRAPGPQRAVRGRKAGEGRGAGGRARRPARQRARAGRRRGGAGYRRML